MLNNNAILIHKVTDETSYLQPVMTPVAGVAGVAGIWLSALDLHLSHTQRSEN